MWKNLRTAVLFVAALFLSLPPAGRAETAAEHDARMQWWRSGRFGMFIHWGLYSELAGEWRGTKTKGAGEWIMNDLKIPADEYEKELLPRFNPTKFDAREWVRIAKDAGMTYIVITSKHHDGFCLFDSKFTRYSVASTPFKRDVLKELAIAAQEADVKICWYHSIMDWHHPLARGDTFPQYAQTMRHQLRELLTHYGDIGVLWFDGEWINEWTEDQAKDLYAHLRQIQPSLIINNRISKARAGMEGLSKYKGAGDYGTPEQQVPKTAPEGDWETCMTMNNTWGYKAGDQNWKSSEQLIRTLVDVASKGGNFLLNVGPTGEGLIPDASVQRLADIGKWMKVNSESIYGTTRSPLKDDLPWGRITAKSDRLYLHVFDWPADGKLTLPKVDGRTVASVTLLAKPGQALRHVDADGMITIDLPEKAVDPVDTVVVLQTK